MSPVYFVTQVLSTLRGSAPVARRQGVSPIFRASLVQTGSAALRPLHFVPGWVIPLSLRLATPRLRQVAFGMYMPRFNAEVQQARHPRRKHP